MSNPTGQSSPSDAADPATAAFSVTVNSLLRDLRRELGYVGRLVPATVEEYVESVVQSMSEFGMNPHEALNQSMVRHNDISGGLRRRFFTASYTAAAHAERLNQVANMCRSRIITKILEMSDSDVRAIQAVYGLLVIDADQTDREALELISEIFKVLRSQYATRHVIDIGAAVELIVGDTIADTFIRQQRILPAVSLPASQPDTAS